MSSVLHPHQPLCAGGGDYYVGAGFLRLLYTLPNIFSSQVGEGGATCL